MFNDPVLFAQEFLVAFAKHEKGMLRAPDDVQQGSGVGHLTKSWPDELTGMDLLSTLLRRGLGTSTIFTQQTQTYVHNLNGGMWSVELHDATVRAPLRLLIAEVTWSRFSKPRAQDA